MTYVGSEFQAVMYLLYVSLSLIQHVEREKDETIFWNCFFFVGLFVFSWSIDLNLFRFFLFFFFQFQRGLVPAVAEMRYLDRVKWLDLYGVDLHPVLVSSISLSLSLVISIHLTFSHNAKITFKQKHTFILFLFGFYLFFVSVFLFSWFGFFFFLLPGAEQQQLNIARWETHTLVNRWISLSIFQSHRVVFVVVVIVFPLGGLDNSVDDTHISTCLIPF